MKASPRPLADQRRDLIRALMDERGAVRTADLAAELGVSLVTVRRDLLALEVAGEAVVVHGGARTANGRVPPADRGQRSGVEVDAKALIAATAIRRVHEGDAVFLDSGTTCAAMIPLLARFERLLVVTTDLHTATALAAIAPHLEIVVAAGRVDATTASVHGELVAMVLASFVFDTAFISATAWQRGYGATSGTLTYAGSKRTAISRARHKVLLVDSTKYGIAEPHVVLSLDRFDAVVTDDLVPVEARRELREAGISLVIADRESPVDS
ncbi:DeoR/GlpR family DNA-binding transcription regulator [Microbacterium jiangjiandongii]|uniref:DeoR/GlpR family DNA-binding transcription regulator n=1 Tax=Microbacterium jiangjiandongii TaxID=3049071 RepID=UPI00214B62BF|nr:DeoR/GlpR family DNA-binding transcription regulator [Microbacterium sp. zg.Y843]MCR2816852.1 DeoR/GlpR family DNA-binding transcription regulator [Microbacterium sp. zg.Y843]